MPCIESTVCFLCACFAIAGSAETSRRQEKFTEQLQSTCSAFPFFQKFIAMLHSPPSEYILYSFYDPRFKKSGGLGDRLAGLITATAYSITSNRTLLIQGDNAFTTAFIPYSPSSAIPRSWADWEWSGWLPHFTRNMTTLHCLNPKPRAHSCTLTTSELSRYKVIKYRSNRSFLCYWLHKGSPATRQQLAHMGITTATDLYKAAGCLLRLAMHPTPTLWDSVETYLQSQLSSHHALPQIGFHYRCGDSSFTSSAYNPECFYNASLSWKGTSFIDSKTFDSPIDLARCGKTLLQAYQQAVAYISSDYTPAAMQIREALEVPLALVPASPCHLEAARSNKMCMLSTILSWFVLALSEGLVVQGLVEGGGGGGVKAPASAFSRQAAMYGLLRGDQWRYAGNCTAVDTKSIGDRDHGNWLCDSIY